MPLTSDRIAERCRDDGEFRLAARYWNGSLSIDLDGLRLEFVVVEGAISSCSPVGGPLVALAAPADVWAKLLAPVPPPRFNDIMPARAFGLRVEGDEETFYQYYPAIRRLVDILRQETAETEGDSDAATLR